MTPTVKIIAPMQIEQSNSILRELKSCIEYLVRVNILSENYQNEWFNTSDTSRLLEEFVTPNIKEISYCGINLKFLNYSASQIKQKSWWDYVDNSGFKLLGDQDDPAVESSSSHSSSKALSLFVKELGNNRDDFLDCIG